MQSSNQSQYIWQPLKIGDIVDVVAPAASCEKEEIEKIKDLLLISWNLMPRVDQAIFGEDLLCANSDENRFLQLKEALLNPESKAVWCARGGYGSARLIAELEKLPIPQHNKLFIGFSDITVLHLFLTQKWHWPTLLGPSARQVALELIEQDNIQEIKKIIFGKQKIIEFNLTPLNQAAQQEQGIDGLITGGTLSLVQTSIGTSWQVDTKNKILFFEDVNERGYKVDRMLQHLKQAGIFSEVKAVLLGDFVGGAEPEGYSVVDAVLKRFAEENNFPVLRCFGIGHGKQNRVLSLGTAADLVLGEHCSLTIKIN